MKFFKSEKEEAGGSDPLGEIDVGSATFYFEVESDANGEFTIW